MKEFHPISIHGSAWESLAPGQTLQVLSLHNRAANLMSAGGQILTLVHPTLGNGPGAALVAEPWPFPCQLGEQVRVIVTGVPRWDPPAPPTRIQIDVGPAVRSVAAMGSRAGILPATLAHLQYEMTARPAGLAGVLFDMALEGITALVSGDWQRGARRLAGLGPGLTPSGDDLLCGYLLCLQRAGKVDQAKALADAVKALPDSATTPLSRHLLAWACLGAAGEHHLAFLDSLLTGGGPAYLAPLLAHGATSGADWAAGALLAAINIVKGE